nr:MAG TPA: hypothetical protein [Caudoviricetes sp.]DAV74842.1 MAG TPA: hypothetical protein [Caudoviricetes sp.]
MLDTPPSQKYLCFLLSKNRKSFIIIRKGSG